MGRREMFVVETYAAVRRFVFQEGRSRREASRVFGLSRDTIAKMCRYSAPPGYVRSRPADKPKLGPLMPAIEAILEADRAAPVKRRHTAKRIFERLRDEHGYGGGYTVVKDYVRQQRARVREVFVPLSHPPGHAQVDFGEAEAVVGGVRQKVHFFCLDLPQSDACFVKAYPRETTESFLDGHVSAFAFFGGVPLSILYRAWRTFWAVAPGRRGKCSVVISNGSPSLLRSSGSSVSSSASSAAESQRLVNMKAARARISSGATSPVMTAGSASMPNSFRAEATSCGAPFWTF